MRARKALLCAAAFAVVAIFGQVHAKGNSAAAILTAGPGTSGGIEGTPDSQVVVDISGAESWDLIDDVDNVIADCVGGGTITGIGFDVTITTVGASWLSEPVIQFTNSAGSADPNAINLTAGLNDDMPGTMSYTSGGIIDFSDNALPNITAAGDGILRMQFFESFDDVADAVDAVFDSGTLTFDGIGLVDNTGDAACPFSGAGGGGGVGNPNDAASVPALGWTGLFALILGVVLVAGRQFRS